MARVQSEPHPDKRAHMALDNADDALRQARDAYDKSDNEAMAARLEEVEHSVELAESSLKQTGKNPDEEFKARQRARIIERMLSKR
jgi:hypothetical protein